MAGLIFVSGMLAAGAGIGGGGLYVPIFLMFGWGKLAVVRSLAATTGLALALLFLVMFQRHPEADRPAVDYRAMLVLEPIVLLGTVPGKILNDLFPPVIVYVFLLVLLLVITYRSWLKYFKFKARDDARLANEALEVELSELGDVESKDVEKKLDSDDGVVVSEALRGYSPKTAKRKQIKRQLTIHKESKNPVRSILLLVLCWAVLLALALSIKLETECNSTLYWILTALYILFSHITLVFISKQTVMTDTFPCCGVSVLLMVSLWERNIEESFRWILNGFLVTFNGRISAS